MFTRIKLLDEAVALEMAARLHRAYWSVGLIRGGQAAISIKDNQEIIPRSEADPEWDMTKAIRDAVLSCGAMMATTMLYKMTVPKFNRYTGGETYRRHFDASPMSEPTMRTDFACTVSLTPPEDYDGGDLHIESPEGGVVMAPRCKPGECVVYECGNAHWVTPVTRGERVSSIMWIRSLVKSPENRRLLVRLTSLVKRLERDKKPIEAGSDDFVTLTGIQTALCRMWIDT